MEAGQLENELREALSVVSGLRMALDNDLIQLKGMIDGTNRVNIEVADSLLQSSIASLQKQNDTLDAFRQGRTLQK